MLWWLGRHRWLGNRTTSAIEAADEVHISAASVWEVSIKRALGKLQAPADLTEGLRANAFRELPVGWAHARAAGALPLHHRDPFDRILVAQAQVERLTLVTSDEHIRRYDVPLLEVP